jgi:hypothetical protein
MEETPKRVGYKLANGKWVVVPALPIIHAKLPIPGNVTRPDGKVVYVEVVPDDAELSGA